MALGKRFLVIIAALVSPLSAQAEGFSVPVTIGSIVRSHMSDGGAPPDYVLVQDVHGHGEAQTHIAELLNLLRDRWGIKKTFIEGAFTKVQRHDLPAAYLDDAQRKLLAAQGELSGPELAFLENPNEDAGLIGVDDPSLYRQTLQIYERLRRDRDVLRAEGRPFSKLENALLNLQMTPAEHDAWRAQAMEAAGSDHWKNAIGMAELFYALTDQRSRNFVDKAAATPVEGPRVLVTGGYHVQKMCAILEQAGKSFIVLRPTLTRGGFAQVYAAHLEESARLLQTPALVALATTR